MRAMPAGASGVEWIRQRSGAALSSKATGIVALDESGNIRGGVAFDGWTQNACHAHMALDAPIAARALLRPVFEYVFGQLGLGVMLGVIQSTNARSLRLAERLGFRKSYTMRDGWAKGVDLVFLELRREDCKFLRSEAA